MLRILFSLVLVLAFLSLGSGCNNQGSPKSDAVTTPPKGGPASFNRLPAPPPPPPRSNK